LLACCSMMLFVFHFGFVRNWFSVFWSFLFMRRLFRLVMSCSFLLALTGASSVLQKLLNCGFVKYCLKCEKMFLSLLGIPDKNLNIDFNMSYEKNKL
jgi:hypothetical protein